MRNCASNHIAPNSINTLESMPDHDRRHRGVYTSQNVHWPVSVVVLDGTIYLEKTRRGEEEEPPLLDDYERRSCICCTDPCMLSSRDSRSEEGCKRQLIGQEGGTTHERMGTVKRAQDNRLLKRAGTIRRILNESNVQIAPSRVEIKIERRSSRTAPAAYVTVLRLARIRFDIPCIGALDGFHVPGMSRKQLIGRHDIGLLASGQIDKIDSEKWI